MSPPDIIYVRFWPNGATSVHTEPYDGAVVYEIVEEPDEEKEERERK